MGEGEIGVGFSVNDEIYPMVFLLVSSLYFSL